MKFVVALLIIASGILGYFAWTQHRFIQEVEARAAEVEQEKEAEKLRADSIALVTDSLLRVADSIDAVRQEEKAAAARRAAELRARGDSLAIAIVNLVPVDLVGEQVAEQVALAVGQLRASYEDQLSDQADLLQHAEEELAIFRGMEFEHEEEKEALRRALALSEQQTAIWKAAANPGFLGGLWKQKGPLSAALTLGVLGGMLIGG